MSNSFCRYLTNGLRVQSWHGILAASPCCYLTQIPISSTEFDQSMIEYHQRQNCSNCLYYVSGDTNNPNYPPTHSKQIIPDVEHTHPVYAELSIDNKCNAACLSCTDLFSSHWAEQNKKFNIKTIDDYPDPQNDALVVEDLFNKFNFSYLTELNFLGGEPLISQANLLVIERLINLGVASNIKILFTTNGSTRLTDRQLELFKHFKKITFSYSIDGIDNRFHYLRYPLKWEKLLSSIESTNSIDANIIVNMTVSALSAFYINEVHQWALEYFKNNPRFINFHTPRCNDIMSLDALPLEAKHYLQSKYSNNNQLSNLFDGNTSNENIKKFLSHLQTWDQNRNLNWMEEFPEAVPFYTKYL